MAEKHATINRREGDTIALLLVLKAHCSHVPVGDANAHKSNPSISPNCRQPRSPGRSPVQVRGRRAPREAGREGAASEGTPTSGSGSEASHISTTVPGAKSSPCHPDQMFTPITGPSFSTPARCGAAWPLPHHIPHTAPAILSSRQGASATPQGHGGLGRRTRLAALLLPDMLSRTTTAAGAVLHPDVTLKRHPSCNSSQSQELRDTEIQEL